MKISSLDKTVADLLKEFLFVPRFQRPYSWEREQVEQFWHDTIVERDGDYFIGAVVLYKQGDAWGIVDGQQRITTMVMLLAAVRDAYDDHKLPAQAAGIQAILEKTDIDNKKRFVLATESSFPFLQDKILSRGNTKLKQDLGTEDASLQQMFEDLRQHIDDALISWPPVGKSKASDRQEAALKLIRDRVLGLKLITVELDNEDDAYLIFETLNTRGKDLQVSHLLKNHLSRLLKPTNKGLDPLKLRWSELLGVFEASQADIDLETFLHHFWLSRAKYVTAKKLFSDMKKEIKKTDIADIILDDLVNDAGLYRAIIEPSFGKWKKEEGQIRKSLAALGVFRVQQPFPLVLSVMRAYKGGKISKKNAEAMLWAVEQFHFTFTAITSKSSSGGISFMYASWAKALFRAGAQPASQKAMNDVIKGLKSRRPSEDDFVAGFKELRYSDRFTKQKKLVQYILRMFADHEADGGVAVDHEQMTIEHVASQNPAGSATISEDHVAMIGNLLWCDSKVQDKLKNKAFAEKRNILKTSDVPGAEAVAGKAAWGETEIEERTKAMAQLAYNKIWA
jgi:uncharacterized protein with ParB-like and HNH nuclease domain